MALRVAVLASLPVKLLGAEAAPGSSCEVSYCCQAYRNPSPFLGDVFNNRGGAGSRHLTSWEESAGFAPACSMLNLVPGAFDKQGACAASLAAMRGSTVSEAIAASVEASERLLSGRSVLSTFVEPGTCAEVQEAGCWATGAAPSSSSLYSWQSGAGDREYWSRWCTGVSPIASPALAWTMRCSSEGELTLRAQWAEGADPDKRADQHCSLDYSGVFDLEAAVATQNWTADSPARGRNLEAAVASDDWMAGSPRSLHLNVTLAADDWTAGPAGSPRWRCFDMPGGPPGSADSRILVYSIGDLPCAAANEDHAGHALSALLSASCRSSLAALAFAAAVVVGVAVL